MFLAFSQIKNKNISKTSKISNESLKCPLNHISTIVNNDIKDNQGYTTYENNLSARKLVKKTSSMQCLYRISKSEILKSTNSERMFNSKKIVKISLRNTETASPNMLHNSDSKLKPQKISGKASSKRQKTEENMEAKHLNDYFASLEKRIQRKVPASELKNRFEISLTKESKSKFLGTFQNNSKNSCRRFEDSKFRFQILKTAENLFL